MTGLLYKGIKVDLAGSLWMQNLTQVKLTIHAEAEGASRTCAYF